MRQVYAALVVAAAVAALGGLTTLVYSVLLAEFGGAAWRSVLADHTQAAATVLVATPVWWYHRHHLAADAPARALPVKPRQLGNGRLAEGVGCRHQHQHGKLAGTGLETLVGKRRVVCGDHVYNERL